jgi:hypothetical protein
MYLLTDLIRNINTEKKSIIEIEHQNNFFSEIERFKLDIFTIYFVAFIIFLSFQIKSTQQFNT